MASCFATVFACCLRHGRSGSPGQEGPDERTHLIPPTSDEPSSHEPYVVDQQQLNARLGPIVRAKEGKMVNVNTPLPFNLHNRPLHDPSSRSASTHLDPSAAQGRVPDSPPRDDSASPSIPTSRSTSSLQPGDASYLPPESDPECGRRTVLDVRLVRGPPGAGVWTRRGRSVTRGRYSRFGGDGSSARQSQHEQKVWDGNGVANGECVLPTAAEVEVDDPEQNKENGVAGEDERAEEAEEAESTPHPPAGGLSAGGRADAEGGAKAAAPDFHIEIADVGKISQSWGD